ncbi:MAG: hypothetical protein IJF03_00590 [Lachnospiraceae bacterium]|nr:hypothetical protein [Lachnospiraceae bacterium]
MKKKTVKKIRKKLAVVLVAGAVVAVSVYTYPLAKAVFQRENAVHINAETIENSTMIVGTHLIHISALNDELYDMAAKSAERSGQQEIYYKSELAGGKWYNITSASSISDITEEGEAVSDSKIEELLLTHHTKSDGITYDLKKNIAVCIYDIFAPYELESLEELEPLCNQYNLTKEREKNTEMQTSNSKLVEKFLELDITTQQTKVYDEQLETLQEYYTKMNKEGTDKENIAVVLKVMGKIDASRRKEALQTISKELSELEENIRDISTVSDKDEVQASEMYDVDEALLEALLESQTRVEESLITYDGNSFAEGTTRMSKLEYDLSKRLVQNCDTSTSDCEETVESLIHLSHIMEGSVIAPVSEVELLNDLLKDMESEYESVLKKGSSASDSTGDAETKRSELQFYVRSKAERLEVEEAQSFVEECLEKSSKFIEAAPTGDNGKEALASAKQYQNWLKELVTEYAAGDGTSELQKLKEEKEELEAQKLSALDNNQVEQANKIQALLDETVSKIEAAEKEINTQISKLNAQKAKLESGEENAGGDVEGKIADIEKQIALLTAKLPENSTTVNIQESKEKLLQMIEKHEITAENQEEASIVVEALGALLTTGSQSAGEALKEVYREMAADTYLSESKAYDALMNRIEELVADNQVILNQSLLSEKQAFSVLKNILGEDIGNLFGLGNGEEVAEEDLEEVTADVPEDEEEFSEEAVEEEDMEDGEEWEEDEEYSEENSEEDTEDTTGYEYSYDTSKIDKKDLQAAILALAQTAEQTNNEALENLALTMTQAVYNQEENSGIFVCKNEGTETFAPVSYLADYLGYRYVWSDTKKTGIMSKGSAYYGFQAFRRDVEKREGKREELPCNALFGGEVYIPFTYIEEKFNCQATAIGNTGYGIFADEEVQEKTEEIAQALMEAN